MKKLQVSDEVYAREWEKVKSRNMHTLEEKSNIMDAYYHGSKTLLKRKNVEGLRIGRDLVEAEMESGKSIFSDWLLLCQLAWINAEIARRIGEVE